MTGSATIDVPFDGVAELGDAIIDRVNEARAEEPIFWSARLNSWIVTSHRECMEAFSGRLPLSTSRFQKFVLAVIPEEEREARIPYLLRTLPSWIVNVDPPVHTRLRKLMLPAFSRRVAEGQRDFCREVIAEVFAGTTGTVVELVERIARPIPARVILRLLGLPEALLPNLREWSSALNGAFGGQPITAAAVERAERALLEMRGHFLAEIEKRRAAPRDDFLSLLLAARDEGDRLTDEEMLGICYITLIAGHDTTMNTIALGTAALARHPEALDDIRANPDNLPNSVMEIMRYVAMSFSKVRTVSQDFEWNGHQLREGDRVYLTIAGANRDPLVFESPETLDLARPQHRNMTFAPGIHHCIGHLVAKAELEEYFRYLADNFSPILIDPKLKFGPVSGFRGLEKLHIRLDPRR